MGFFRGERSLLGGVRFTCMGHWVWVEMWGWVHGSHPGALQLNGCGALCVVRMRVNIVALHGHLRWGALGMHMEGAEHHTQCATHSSALHTVCLLQRLSRRAVPLWPGCDFLLHTLTLQ